MSDRCDIRKKLDDLKSPPPPGSILYTEIDPPLKIKYSPHNKHMP